MGWVLAAGGSPSFQFSSHPPAAQESVSRARFTVTTLAVLSPSDDSSVGKVNGSRRRRRRPTAAEVRLAIGVDELPRPDGGTPSSGSSSSSSSSSRLMDFLATTPIGQPESPAERALRQLGEWVVDRTEARSGNGNLLYLFNEFCSSPIGFDESDAPLFEWATCVDLASFGCLRDHKVTI